MRGLRYHCATPRWAGVSTQPAWVAYGLRPSTGLYGRQESNLHLEGKSQLLSQFQLRPLEGSHHHSPPMALADPIRCTPKPCPCDFQCRPWDSNPQHLGSEPSTSYQLG